MHPSRKDSIALETLESRKLLSSAPLVMGYLVDYKISNTSNTEFSEKSSGSIAHDNLNWNVLKEVNYFALLPNSNGTLQSKTDSGFDPSKQLPSIVSEANKHGAKVYITIGGGDSAAIADMKKLIDNTSAYSTFASSLKSFCSKYGVAGVDLDWEPSSATGTEIENFGKLIKTINQNDSSLKLTSDTLGDPIELVNSSGKNIGSSYMLNSTAVQNLDAVNVEAYPVGSKSEADTVMSDWASYVSSGKDLDGIKVGGHTAQLQYGIDIDSDDSSNKPSGVIEGKVDLTISKGYGGLFVFELDSDTANPSAISRIGSEITKDTNSSGGPGGSVSGTVKNTSGSGIGGITIYLDANNNSAPDANELKTTTTTNGIYTFTDVPAVAYVIRQSLSAGDKQTSPSSNFGIHITVTKGSKLTNENFTDSVSISSSAELTGKLIGSSTSLNNAKSGDGAANAFDNKTSTVFEDTQANGNWIGLDLGKTFSITQIKFAADPANPSFMEGGVFQASNSSTFSSGVVDLYTVPNTSTPSTSLTTVNVSNSSAFRYVRYLPPVGSFGDVAEVDFCGMVS